MDADSTRAPHGATALTTTDDADIIAAWERFAANRIAVGELRDDDPDYLEREDRLWTAIGNDEALIGKTVAKTVVGAEIQLWCILSHEVSGWANELAVFRRDVEHLDRIDSDLDWITRLALQAIRSLRAIGGAA